MSQEESEVSRRSPRKDFHARGSSSFLAQRHVEAAEGRGAYRISEQYRESLRETSRELAHVKAELLLSRSAVRAAESQDASQVQDLIRQRDDLQDKLRFQVCIQGVENTTACQRNSLNPVSGDANSPC